MSLVKKIIRLTPTICNLLRLAVFLPILVSASSVPASAYWYFKTISEDATRGQLQLAATELGIDSRNRANSTTAYESDGLLLVRWQTGIVCRFTHYCPTYVRFENDRLGKTARVYYLPQFFYAEDALEVRESMTGSGSHKVTREYLFVADRVCAFGRILCIFPAIGVRIDINSLDINWNFGSH